MIESANAFLMLLKSFCYLINPFYQICLLLTVRIIEFLKRSLNILNYSLYNIQICINLHGHLSGFAKIEHLCAFEFVEISNCTIEEFLKLFIQSLVRPLLFSAYKKYLLREIHYNRLPGD